MNKIVVVANRFHFIDEGSQHLLRKLDKSHFTKKVTYSTIRLRLKELTMIST